MDMKRSLLKRLDQGIVLAAEGYIFELERRGYLQSGAYVPEVVLDYPDAVKELHREFLRAGSDVMVALTYYAHREKMKTIGRELDLEELNRQAVKLAREVAAEGDALVAGNLSNTWVYDHQHHDQTAKIVQNIFEEQAGWAVEEGVDFIIAETISYIGEARIALNAIKKFNVPAVIMLAPIDEKVVEGYSYEDACRILEDEGADVVGLNCARGPETMLPIIERIRKTVKGYVAALPVTYRTTTEQPTFQALKEQGQERAFPIALDPFQHTRFEMADFAKHAQRIGVNYIGTCCGAGPHHFRAMAEALGRTVPASRYSPDLSKHAMLGNNVQEHSEQFLSHWKD